jgi:Fe-S-cluster-containing dehydrogenase component
MAHRFGMAVDLDRCTGFEACVAVPCRKQHCSRRTAGSRGRALRWIERYFEGEFPDGNWKYAR